MSQKAFLESEFSGPKFSGTSSEIVAFSKKLKAFRNGDLKMEAVDFKRKAERKFIEIEDKLIAYMKLHSKAYVQNKCEISWNLLTEKATEYAAKLGIQEKDFKASDGWLQGVLKQSGMNAIVDEEVELLQTETGISDGESDVDIEDTEEEEIMTFLEAEEALRKLTISCNKLGIPESATVHLDCFKKALFKAKAGKNEEHQHS